MTLTREQIEKLRGDWQEQAWPDRAEMDQIDALCDLALAAREMEERAKKAEYQVLGYKGDYDELCKRYTTCERELGSVMKERDAMREAIKRADEKLAVIDSGFDTIWSGLHKAIAEIRADLENVLVHTLSADLSLWLHPRSRRRSGE